MIYEDVSLILKMAAACERPPVGKTVEQAIADLKAMLDQLRGQRRYEKKLEYMVGWRKRHRANANAAATAAMLSMEGNMQKRNK